MSERNIRYDTIRSSGLPLIFSTYGAWRPHPSPELAIRSAVDPKDLVPELKARLEALAPGVRIRRIESAEERMYVALSQQKLLLERNLNVLGTMAAVAPLVGSAVKSAWGGGALRRW